MIILKICSECGFENIDEASFCKNCGEKLELKTEPVRPIDNTKIIVKEKNEGIVSKLFFKNDKHTGELRFAKTKSISIIVFVVCFLFSFVIYLSSVIFALIFAVPTYIIGFVVGLIVDRLTH